MNYKDWQNTLPQNITDDILWKMEVYRQALFLSELAWMDSTKLQEDRRSNLIASQVYRAVGSISANIAEGYSRKSRKDQARYYEYALGSAREARTWYFQSRKVLGEAVVSHRLELITQIIKQLLVIIPSNRGHKISEEQADYSIDIFLSEAPIP